MHDGVRTSIGLKVWETSERAGVGSWETLCGMRIPLYRALASRFPETYRIRSQACAIAIQLQRIGIETRCVLSIRCSAISHPARLSRAQAIQQNLTESDSLKSVS